MTLKLRLALGVTIAVIATPPASVATEHDSRTADASVAEHMHLHLSRIRAIKAFIIAGQLEGVGEPAVWLAEHEVAEGLPGDWSPYVEDIRNYSREVASAGHLLFAAIAVSEMARTCGDCHQANGVSVNLSEDVKPPNNGDSVRAQMQRHLWAADRMWEGLIGPSETAWKQGTESLTEIQLNASDIGAAPDQEPQVTYLLRRARELGEAGAQATSPKTRSAIYGEFLSLCADCHAMTGGGPAPLAKSAIRSPR